MLKKQAEPSRSNPKTRQRQATLSFLFVLLAVIFGGAFVATKAVGAAISSMQGSCLRLGIALVLLQVFYALLKKPLKLPARSLPMVWFAGILLLAIPYILFFWGLRYVSPGLGGVVESTLPIFVFLCACIFTRSSKPLCLNHLAGLSIGLVGILLVFGNKIEFSGNHQETLGIALLFLEVLAFALGTILNRRILSGNKRSELHAVLYHQNLASLIFVLLVTLFIEGLPQWSGAQFTLPVIAGILFLGIFPTAIANYLFALLIKEWGSVRAGAVGYLIPVAAFLLDFLCFGNVPTPLEVAGAFIILLGVFLLQSPKLRLPTVIKLRPVLAPTNIAFSRAD